MSTIENNLQYSTMNEQMNERVNEWIMFILIGDMVTIIKTLMLLL